MKRLTKRTVAGTANIDYEGCAFPNGEKDYIAQSARRQLAIDRLAAIEDILGDEYDLDRLRELVEFYSNVPHICDYCIGCEIEPTDGHGCDGYDNFVFSVRRVVSALKARKQDD